MCRSAGSGAAGDRLIRPVKPRRPVSRRPVTPATAHRFVERNGLVLLSARGPIPNLAEAVAGGPIRGSWWGHPRGREIFRAMGAVAKSGNVVICRLVRGRLTFVHRRLWPALVRLAPRLPRAALSAIEEEHMASGAHRTIVTPFPRWVPADVRGAARRLGLKEAREILGTWLPALGLD